MNFSLRSPSKLLVSIILCIYTSAIQAQDRTFTTFFPGLSVTIPLKNHIDLNLSSSIQYNLDDLTYGDQNFPAAINYYDFQAGMVYKFTQQVHFAAAWYYRQNDPGRVTSSSENRFWQQISVTSLLNNMRLRNRFRLEERIISKESQATPLRWRFRYQIALETPLQGEKTDVGEFYLLIANEAYFSLNRPRNAIYNENWISGLLGYRLTKQNRFEVGPVWQAQIRNASKDMNNFFHLQLNFLFLLNFKKSTSIK